MSFFRLNIEPADHSRAQRLRLGGLLAAVVGACAVAAGSCLASGVADLSGDARRLLDRQELALPGDVEITVGEPDPRLVLAPCVHYEPFVPVGARLWGRTTLGVRCVEGATWTVFLPVQIKVFASAPVAARSIARGQPLGLDDVRMERVELTKFPPGTLAQPDQIEGRLATRMLLAGEPLRRDLLRQPPVIVPGEAVKVVFTAATFTVSTDGRSLTMAGDGQTVQASVPGGKILSGIARPGKIVELQ